MFVVLYRGYAFSTPPKKPSHIHHKPVDRTDLHGRDKTVMIWR